MCQIDSVIDVSGSMLKTSALTSAASVLKTKSRLCACILWAPHTMNLFVFKIRLQGHSVACFSKLFILFLLAVNCVAISDASSYVKSQRYDPSRRYPFGPLFFLVTVNITYTASVSSRRALSYGCFMFFLHKAALEHVYWAERFGMLGVPVASGVLFGHSVA